MADPEKLFRNYNEARNLTPDDDSDNVHPRINSPEEIELAVGETNALFNQVGENPVDPEDLASIIGFLHWANSGDNTKKFVFPEDPTEGSGNNIR